MNASWNKTFGEAFCEHHRCPRDAYEWRVFCLCLPSGIRWICRLIHTFNKRFFQDDLGAIRRLGNTGDDEQFARELNDFDYVVRRQGGFLRRRLGFTVSRGRLIQLKQQVNAAANHPEDRA